MVHAEHLCTRAVFHEVGCGKRQYGTHMLDLREASSSTIGQRQQFSVFKWFGQRAIIAAVRGCGMTAVSVCITWSRPDDEHARGLCTNTLQLETQPPEIEKPLPCYICVNPVSPGRVEGCRQCADWDTNDKLVRYIGQATDPDEVLPNAIEFSLNGSIGGTVGQQLITQELPQTHPLSKAGTRYLYTPVLQPGNIKTSGVLRQLSAFSGLADQAWMLGAEIKYQAQTAEDAQLAIENDNSCLWGLGEFWTHSRSYLGPRGFNISQYSMLTDNIVYECIYFGPPGTNFNNFWTLSPASRPLFGGPLPGTVALTTAGIAVKMEVGSISSFIGCERTDPDVWKWPSIVGDLFSLIDAGNASNAARLFPFWRGAGSGGQLFGVSGYTQSAVQEFTVSSVNAYKDGNIYDYVASLAGVTPGGYSGAGDSTSGLRHYWSSSDPYDRSYYASHCRSRFIHRIARETGKATIGYRWNLFSAFTSSPTDAANPSGGGYATLLRLDIETPTPNNTPTKIPLWTWCDVVKPGKLRAGYGPGMDVLTNRWCTNFVGECATSMPICFKDNVQYTLVQLDHTWCRTSFGTCLSCAKWAYDSNTPADITLGESGCCELYAGDTGGGGNAPGQTHFDAWFGATLSQTCGIRVNRNGSLPAVNGWTELMNQTREAWGTMFWGVDQHNPTVDFKSGWRNWIETTEAEDAAVRAQLPTIGRLAANVAQRQQWAGPNTLALYKVTKSLAHCDRKRFDLKLIWARTEAYGCTFDGPKAVPSTYPQTGSLFWD